MNFIDTSNLYLYPLANIKIRTPSIVLFMILKDQIHIYYFNLFPSPQIPIVYYDFGPMPSKLSISNILDIFKIRTQEQFKYIYNLRNYVINLQNYLQIYRNKYKIPANTRKFFINIRQILSNPHKFHGNTLKIFKTLLQTIQTLYYTGTALSLLILLGE